MRSTKTYLGVSGPNASTAPVVPTNPARIGLLVVNTGGNPGVFRLGGPVQGNGSDIPLASLAREKWENPDSCPTEAISVASTAATTWSIVETVK